MSEITVQAGKSPAAARPAATMGAFLWGALRRAAAAVVRWQQNRAAMAMLSGADGAVLRDLGIARSDVERVVSHGRDAADQT